MKVRNQKQKKEDKIASKAIDRSNDVTEVRGFTTDQRLNIETVKINRQRLTHQKDETRLVGMSIQEAAIGRQIDSAESRARERCPTYKATNMYWKRADDLIKEQTKITELITSYNDALLNDDDKREEQNEKAITDIVNKPSPVKKSKKRSYEELKDDASEQIVIMDDDDDDDEGLSVKMERINELTTNKGTVSRGRWSKRKRS